ncbi:MAG: 4Fe-4S dicluster domain-containing protein [Candidatus Eisenbacteria bacterium]|nr:4Fe-4S dicluster domain-containing protein [Candidatus Eisenbacteria bacterium]
MAVTKQFGFFFDQDACIGCRSCEGACKNQWRADVGVRYRRVHTYEGGRYPHPVVAYLSLACNHCEDPACIKVCPAKRIVKREQDGLVIYNDVGVKPDGTLDLSKVTCIFCGQCREACPYGVPQPNEKPADGGPQRYEKCIACYPRLDAGLQPACVASCLGGALFWGEVAANERLPGAVREIENFPDPAITRPSTRFRKARRTAPDMAEVTNR